METVQTQTQPSRAVPVPMWAALLKLLAQPTRLSLFDSGKHMRSGYTKNKMQGESKARRKMTRESRRRNRP